MRPASLAAPLPALATDRRGIAAVEFGFVAPLLALLLLGISDIAMAVAAKMSAQQAAARAIEMVNVSGLNSAAFSQVRAEAATAAGVAVDQVAVSSWLECDGVKQADFDTSCASGAQTARFISLVVNATYDPMFDIAFKALGIGRNGLVPVTGKASVRLQ
jgi:Flp pilus assembly protein TadG